LACASTDPRRAVEPGADGCTASSTMPVNTTGGTSTSTARSNGSRRNATMVKIGSTVNTVIS
jgi:hypothetical protein